MLTYAATAWYNEFNREKGGDNMTVGEKIREARLKKGYTQTELAELLGYKSRSSINKIEV